MNNSESTATIEATTEWEVGREPFVDMASIADADSFIRRHEGELLGFFRTRAPQAADADDLTQESFLRLLRYRRGMPESSLKLLMFRIARNLLTDYWRWSGRREVEEPADMGALTIESPAPSQEQIVDLSLEIRRLERLLLSLPVKCRAVFVLSRVRGMKNKEIARHKGISEKMVEKHIARALRACREQFGETDLAGDGRVVRPSGR